jgi:hypothetical protein
MFMIETVSDRLIQHPSEREGTLLKDTTAENLLDSLSDLEGYPEETLAAYREFEASGQTYYFTPGGFLYRKDPGTEEVGGSFCGYLSDEVWHYRTAA